MPKQQEPSTPVTKPGDPIDLASSVAGEEDPGASIDLMDVPTRAEPPVRQDPGPAGKPA